jgi:hypothetical protein
VCFGQEGPRQLQRRHVREWTRAFVTGFRSVVDTAVRARVESEWPSACALLRAMDYPPRHFTRLGPSTSLPRPRPKQNNSHCTKR